jgi:cytochrome P450
MDMTECGSIPRFIDGGAFRDNPLSFLQAAQAAAGNVVVVAEGRPAFSRAEECTAVVAVFGPAGVQQVLNDAELFGTSISVGANFSLPQALNRINAGLFSMTGKEHTAHQQLLRTTLDAGYVRDADDLIDEGFRRFAEGLQAGQEIPLLSEMRRLALHVSTLLVLGDGDLALGQLIQSYFELRRALSGARTAPKLAQRRALIQMGGRLARLLRARLRSLRAEATAGVISARRCMMGRLCLKGASPAEPTEDQLIAQANTLFMSSSEPIAVSLTWILLLLTQQPHLRGALRQELAGALPRGDVDKPDRAGDRPLLRAVINETLRLLPPNAIMVKLTTRAGQLLGHALPAKCEILLSPFVAHRDPCEFTRPHLFSPDRWHGWKPSPYAYFPFGVGARFCVGRQLAHSVLMRLLTSILGRYDIVLATDQELDWKINITMMPAQDPIVRILSAQPDRVAPSGRLNGPVADLIHF